MGRECKRVPLDFAAPLDKVWHGYLPTAEQQAALDELTEDQQDEWWGNFQRTEPPTGEGFQLWETTSEGSPQSPVFATLRELAVWCETNATTFASFTATADEWEKMLAEDRVHHTEGRIMFI